MSWWSRGEVATLTRASTKDEGQRFIQEIAGWVAENYAMQLPDHKNTNDGGRVRRCQGELP